MLNINPGMNKEIIRKCQKLNEYTRFVSLVREYKELGNTITQSIEIARHEKALESARKMLDKNYPLAEIIDITGLSEQEILNIRL